MCRIAKRCLFLLTKTVDRSSSGAVTMIQQTILVFCANFWKMFAAKKAVFGACFLANLRTICINYIELLANSGEILETHVKTFFDPVCQSFWTGFLRRDATTWDQQTTWSHHSTVGGTLILECCASVTLYERLDSYVLGGAK